MNKTNAHRIEDLDEAQTECLLEGLTGSLKRGRKGKPGHFITLPRRFCRSFPVGRKIRFRGQDHYGAVAVYVNEAAISAIQAHSYYWSDLDRMWTEEEES